jgi:hypothetical protein
MSSLVTAVPSGLVHWCLMPRFFPPYMSETPHCANASRGTAESDFGTICCDGDIVDTSFDMYVHGTRDDIDLADLVCCRNPGIQSERQSPPTDDGQRTHCTAGTPVSLLSLAATNTQNAQSYLIGYTNVTRGVETWQNLAVTGIPYCLWFNTARASAMINVTVPAAQITPWNSSPSPTGTAGIANGGKSSSRTASATQGSPSSGQSQIPTKSVAASSGLTAIWRSLYLLGIFYIGAAVVPGHIA